MLEEECWLSTTPSTKNAENKSVKVKVNLKIKSIATKKKKVLRVCWYFCEPKEIHLDGDVLEQLKKIKI